MHDAGVIVVVLPDVVDREAVPFDQPRAHVVIVIRVGDAGEVHKLKQQQAKNQRADADQQEFLQGCETHSRAL